MAIAARAAVVSKLKLIHLHLCIYLYREQTWTLCHNRWRACTTRHRARCASAWLRKSLPQTWLREWCSPLSFHPPHLLSRKPYTFILSLTCSLSCSINQSSISRSLTHHSLTDWRWRMYLGGLGRHGTKDRGSCKRGPVLGHYRNTLHINASTCLQ